MAQPYSSALMNSFTGTYLGHWVKTATSGNVVFEGPSVADPDRLRFTCSGCNASVQIGSQSFGSGGDLIPSSLQTWVNQHRHRANGTIRAKINNYVEAAIQLSPYIGSTHEISKMEYVFTCYKCPPSCPPSVKFTTIHEDDFITGDGSRLQVPAALTSWMLEHKHEKALQEQMAEIKQIMPGKKFDVIKFDDVLATWSKNQAKSMIANTPPPDPSNWAILPKPFLLPKRAEMPKELPSNPVQDSDTLKTFRGRKFRK